MIQGNNVSETDVFERDTGFIQQGMILKIVTSVIEVYQVVSTKHGCYLPLKSDVL